MVCQVCHRRSGRFVCSGCATGLQPAPDRLLPNGVRLVSAFEHSGPAASLVHDLKYRGLTRFAEVVAVLLAKDLPALPLVPVPRAWSRLLRYGVDPAREIAERIATLNGAAVLASFTRPLHMPRRAGGDHSQPPMPLKVNRYPRERVIVVDDVVTSGATLLGAIESLGLDRVAMAASANAAPGSFTLDHARAGVSRSDQRQRS